MARETPTAPPAEAVVGVGGYLSIPRASDRKKVKRGSVVFLPSEAVKAAQEAAERTGETVAAFVARAIEETMERDGGDPGASESGAGHE